MSLKKSNFPLNRAKLGAGSAGASGIGNGVRYGPSSFRRANGIVLSGAAKFAFFGNQITTNTASETLTVDDNIVRGGFTLPTADVPTETLSGADSTNSTLLINITETLSASDTVNSRNPDARVGFLGVETFVVPSVAARVGYIGVEAFVSPNPQATITYFAAEVWFDDVQSTYAGFVTVF